MQYIFLDTFALKQLTKDHWKALNDYLEKHCFHMIISSLQLIEYYSPIVESGDRTDRAIQLLAVNPFVIVNQTDIYHEEEESYPVILKELPYKLRSEDIFDNLSILERMVVLYRMFHEGITETGFNLKAWVAIHHETKDDWPQHVNAIISYAKETRSIQSKSKFVESLDLRFCEQMLDAVEKLNDPDKQDKSFKKWIGKLADMRERNDSWRMRGIHLSSLIFWYDYIVAKKAIKASDEGDIFHAMIFPYCSVVVTDKSKVDCLEQIQKKDLKYGDVKFLRIGDFITELTTLMNT